MLLVGAWSEGVWCGDRVGVGAEVCGADVCAAMRYMYCQIRKAVKSLSSVQFSSGDSCQMNIASKMCRCKSSQLLCKIEKLNLGVVLGWSFW